MTATLSAPMPQPPAWLTRADQRAYFTRIVCALPRPRPEDREWVLRVAFAAAFPPGYPTRLH